MKPNLKPALNIGLAFIGIGVGACGRLPDVKVGETLHSSPGKSVEAVQIAKDRSRLESCTIGSSQDLSIKDHTYWEINLGSAGSDRIDLVQLDTIKDTGTCDRTRPIFLRTLDAKIMVLEESQQPSIIETRSPFIPIPEDISTK